MRKKAGFNQPKRPVFDEEDDLDLQTPLPGTPATGEDPLWDAYKIKSDWPLRTKIELLLSVWHLTYDTIAEILKITTADIDRIVKEIEDNWRELGKALGPEQKVMERGRLIAELESVKSAIEQQLLLSYDPKLIAQKMTIIEKLAKLKGIDADKGGGNNEDEVAQAFEERLEKKIGTEKLKELADRIKKKTSLEEDEDD